MDRIEHPILPNDMYPHKNMNYYTPEYSIGDVLTQDMYPAYLACPEYNHIYNQRVLDRFLPQNRQELMTDLRPGARICTVNIPPSDQRIITNEQIPLLGKGNMHVFVNNVHRERVSRDARERLCPSRVSRDASNIGNATVFSAKALPSCTSRQCWNVAQHKTSIVDTATPSCHNRITNWTNGMEEDMFNNDTRITTKRMPYKYTRK